jgi:hypothetical protein
MISTGQLDINRREAETIPALDGLRALSIGFVILGHAVGFRRSFALRYSFLHAELGVRIFFIISGFLITTLLLREKEAFGCISLKLFYIRRALRILPAFCAFVATTFILSCFRRLGHTISCLALCSYLYGQLWYVSMGTRPLVVAFRGRAILFLVAASHALREHKEVCRDCRNGDSFRYLHPRTVCAYRHSAYRSRLALCISVCLWTDRHGLSPRHWYVSGATYAERPSMALTFGHRNPGYSIGSFFGHAGLGIGKSLHCCHKQWVAYFLHSSIRAYFQRSRGGGAQ